MDKESYLWGLSKGISNTKKTLMPLMRCMSENGDALTQKTLLVKAIDELEELECKVIEGLKEFATKGETNELG